MSFEDAWDLMLELNIVSEETMQVVTCINGCTVETLNDILYVVTGYRTLEQYAEDELPWWDKADEDDDEESED